MTNPSYTDEQVLDLSEVCREGPMQAAMRHMDIAKALESILADRQRLQAEVDFAWKQHQSAIDDALSIELSAYAKRYEWLRVHGAAPCKDDKHHLDRGLVMRCNVLDDFIDAHLARATPNETKEAKS